MCIAPPKRNIYNWLIEKNMGFVIMMEVCAKGSAAGRAF